MNHDVLAVFNSHVEVLANETGNLHEKTLKNAFLNVGIVTRVAFRHALD